jgi:hypothetical protein
MLFISIFYILKTIFVNIVRVALRITFRLLMTFPAPHKAMRSIAGAGNVGEGGVGMAKP